MFYAVFYSFHGMDWQVWKTVSEKSVAEDMLAFMKKQGWRCFYKEINVPGDA